jgi:hypothetical protein
MQHTQSNHDLGQAATTMYRNTEPTKWYCKVIPNTPSTSLPPTPTVVSTIPTSPHLPPTLKQTSQLPNSVYSPSDKKRRINLSLKSHTTKGRSKKKCIRPISQFPRNTRPKPLSPYTTCTIPKSRNLPLPKGPPHLSLTQSPSLHPITGHQKPDL